MSTLTACPGGTGALHTEHTFLPRQRLQASQDRVLCSSQPARDWKSCFFIFSFFHFDHHFFELKIIIPFLSPLIFSLFFHSCFSFLWHFHFLSFASKMVLGNCHQELFLEPFSFLFILFRFCIVLVICPSFALKIVLGNYQNLEPFSFLYRFGYVSSFEIDLGHCQNSLFLEPSSFFCRFFFRVFFPFRLFSPFAFSKLTLEIIKRRFFSNPFRFFIFLVFFFFFVFHFCFRLFVSVFFRFFSLPFHVCFHFLFSLSFFIFIFLRVCFHVRFCFSFFVWVKVYVCFPVFHVCCRFFLSFHLISNLVYNIYIYVYYLSRF